MRHRQKRRRQSLGCLGLFVLPYRCTHTDSRHHESTRGAVVIRVSVFTRS